VTAVHCAPLSSANQFAALIFTENFATAFQTRTVNGPDPQATGVQRNPGTDYYTESGLVLPDIAGIGLASFGTRVKAVFQSVPSGVTVWVTTTNSGPTATNAAQLVPMETAPYFQVASTATVQGVEVAQVPVVNGTATAVWEVTAASPVSTDSLFFTVFFDSSTAFPLNTPSTTVNGSYAPTYTASAGGSAQTAGTPIPRFLDTSTAVNILSVVPCQTLLLFPYVVSQSGFDTGMAIANTSSDPIGTATQSGACILNAFGTNAPAPVTTPGVASGTAYTTLASTAFPNFMGYVFAVCNFQYAHGFAFVSDVGARNLAMGYLALVVPDNETNPPPVRGAAPRGESLGR
jgi:hypothetical protein